MYVYISHRVSGGTGFEVGYYLTKYNHDGQAYNQFMAETAWPTEEEAAARVNYLNGGTGNPPAVAVPRKEQ